MMKENVVLSQILKNVSKNCYRFNQELNRVEDDLAERLKNCKNEIFYYVGTADLILNYVNSNMASEWKIQNIFSLGYPYCFPLSKNHLINEKDPQQLFNKLQIYGNLINQNWYFVCFCKNNIKTVFVGFNNNDTFTFREKDWYIEKAEEFINKNQESKESVVVIEEWLEIYEDYLINISKVIETNSLENIKITDDYEFNEIPFQNFDINLIKLFSRYKKKIVQDFGLPQLSDKIVDLKDYVKILNEKKDDVIGRKFSFEVEKNDLLIQNFIINPDLQLLIINTKIAANYMDNVDARYVIKSNKIPIEYIKFYLDSQIFKDFCLQNIDAYDYCNNLFFAEPFNMSIDDIQIPIIITDDYSKIVEKQKKISNTKTDLQKSLEFSGKFTDKDATDIVLKDLEEVRICQKYGAYKAAIILAGSILEAFLIDWISEINGVNYFDEDLWIDDKFDKHKRKRADLIDYIDIIKDLRKPDWIEAAKKATTIRKKRNLVHAKLYIENKDISEETCNMVINYLEYVINTRWNLKNSKNKKIIRIKK